jgi:hypothetical protein
VAEPTERRLTVPEERFPGERERAFHAAVLGAALGLILSLLDRRSSARRHS